MWHLKHIRAKNICSFLELEYSPKQGEATLIFGNNQDSDSQNSNGSGKSALIEAVAIALIGETLRKVNIDEIINDSQDEAIISAVLFNSELSEQLTITRRLSRKEPQLIQICKQVGQYDTDVEEITQASVLDYNKYILDRLGLIKDDIFSNFILTARKYKSFLSSSDKEKKEIINRFSNGVMVDESIESLQADIALVQQQLNDASKTVATCTGRVEALAAEIERAINESAADRATNESRIKNWQDLIAEKRAEIRTTNEHIDDIEDSLDSIDQLDVFLQNLEKGDGSIEWIIEKVQSRFASNSIALESDYTREFAVLNNEFTIAQQAVKELAEQLKEAQAALDESDVQYQQSIHALQQRMRANEENRKDSKLRIDKLLQLVKRLQNKADKIISEQRAKQKERSLLENQLAGVITCPKCKHEFVLDSELDIASARASLKEISSYLAKLEAEHKTNETELDKTIADGKNQREIDTALENECRQLQREQEAVERQIAEAHQQLKKIGELTEQKREQLNSIVGKLTKFRTRLFDEAFEVLDSVYKSRENKIKSLEEQISTLQGSIASYEQAIENARSISEKDVVSALKQSQKKYQDELEAANAVYAEVLNQFNILKAQESTFLEFKTYLANTKINAIAQITNDFLATIGSDIRVALSGYTILKSGKVRDKISVTLLRDGIDCGSFEKFSAGERVRVELASILSMNQLTNENCDNGKGLDLLIADEVLDSADEQGLASVFNALNKTKVTSLIVSHGLTNESYPNKITVVKRNGISSIHGNERPQT